MNTMRYRILLTFDDGKQWKTHTAKPRRISRALSENTWGKPWQKCVLTVVYIGPDGRELGDNQGEYYTEASARLAFDAFREPDNVEYMR